MSEKDQNTGEETGTLSELGTKGLTWDWSKMELNKKYFVSREQYITINMLWQLAQGKIVEQAQKLNAELEVWDAPASNGWYLRLIPKTKHENQDNLMNPETK